MCSGGKATIAITQFSNLLIVLIVCMLSAIQHSPSDTNATMPTMPPPTATTIVKQHGYGPDTFEFVEMSNRLKNQLLNYLLHFRKYHSLYNILPILLQHPTDHLFFFILLISVYDQILHLVVYYLELVNFSSYLYMFNIMFITLYLYNICL